MAELQTPQIHIVDAGSRSSVSTPARDDKPGGVARARAPLRAGARPLRRAAASGRAAAAPAGQPPLPRASAAAPQRGQ